MFWKTCGIAALAITMGLGGPVAPATAFAPAPPRAQTATVTDVTPAQYRNWREHRRWNRHHYRDRRPGFRAYPPPVYRGISRHVRWCANRYRSYDARSNTFVGFDGRRHRCRSPF